MEVKEQEHIVKRAQAGDKTAFSQLYDEFIKPIYNFIYYKTHHKETAEDLTSQVFMKAYQRLETFDGSKGPFSAWLYQIARHQVIDHYRAQHPTLDIEDAWGVSSGENVAKDVEMKMQLEKVQAYLGELTAEQRDIVIMRVWQDMSYAEIAATLGKSEASCKMMFARTIQKLRAEIPMLALLLLFSVFRK